MRIRCSERARYLGRDGQRERAVRELVGGGRRGGFAEEDERVVEDVFDGCRVHWICLVSGEHWG